MTTRRNRLEKAENWRKAEWRTCKKCGEWFFHQFFRKCSDCRVDVHDARAVYVPTEEEIRKACEEIREGWDDATEQGRIVGEADKRREFEVLEFRRVRNAKTRSLVGIAAE